MDARAGRAAIWPGDRDRRVSQDEPRLLFENHIFAIRSALNGEWRAHTWRLGAGVRSLRSGFRQAAQTQRGPVNLAGPAADIQA
jgi:hypothetical protein